VDGLDLYNLPFNMESRLAKAWFHYTGLRPSSAPFVSGDSFRAIANHVLEPESEVQPSRVANGDIIFVQSSELNRFAKTILPSIQKMFVLVSHNGDLNVDSSFLQIASNQYLIHWFAQNALLRHSKATAIPIGLENRRLHCNGIVSDFKRLQRRTCSKSLRILSAFSIQTNRTERGYADEILRRCEFADTAQRTNSRTYRTTLMRYGFVASPPGNGVDCHRTWEALYLGVVPIVRRSPFYESFSGLPVVFVDDWKEILDWTQVRLKQLYDDLSPKVRETPYLKFSYWSARIQRAQVSVRSRQAGNA
jgi:hypothetical protein